MENLQIESIKSKTLKDIIYHQLKEDILNNRFPADDYITEQNLANQLEVSRTPLREAMMELVNEFLIDFKPRKGYRIRGYSESEINQIFILRKVIECEIIDPLLENVTYEKLNMLYDIIDGQKQCIKINDGQRFIKLDKEFHREMFLISGYNIFLTSYDHFHNLTIVIGSQAIKQKGRMQEVIHEHNDIISSLESGDADFVKESLTDHLEKTKDNFSDIQKSKDDES